MFWVKIIGFYAICDSVKKYTGFDLKRLNRHQKDYPIKKRLHKKIFS